MISSKARKFAKGRLISAKVRKFTQGLPVHLMCECGRPVRGKHTRCCLACPSTHTANCKDQQCVKKQSKSLEVSLVRGWDDTIKQRISDHLPMMFTVKTGGRVAKRFDAFPRIISWNILKQCRNTGDATNNGFNISETHNAYLRRLQKVADLVALALGLGEIVVLQECPATGTVHFETWMETIVGRCNSKPEFVATPVDSTMSLVTLWNQASWSLLSHYQPSYFASRASACEFEGRLGGTMCILNVHLAWGGPPGSAQRKKHTTNLAKELATFLQATGANVAVAVGDYNLRVADLHSTMRPFSKFGSASLINSSQSWAGRSPQKTTVDGALVHLGQTGGGHN